MKKSAIIRIIIWSIVLALLIGFLALGLGYRTYHRARRALWGNAYVATSPLETQVPVKVGTGSRDQVTDFTGSCTVTQQMNVRETPSTIATIQGTLNAGDTVTVERSDTISGTTWAYISSPIEGWVVADYLESTNATGQSLAPDASGISGGTHTVMQMMNVRERPSMTAPIAGALKQGDAVTVGKSEVVSGTNWAYISSPIQGWVVAEYLEGSAITTVSADQVSKIAVDWVSGTVTIQPGDVSEISFYEESSNEKYPMVWKLREGKLSIQFCEDHSFPDSFHFTLDKDLTILVPKDFSCEELELDTASTDLYVSGLTIREVEVDSASGICRFQNCNIMDLDVDTASGDVYLEGTLNTLDFDAASAKFTGVLYNTPSRMKVDSMSGDLDLTLPEDTGFTVKMDGMSNGFTSDFPTTMRNNSHVCGDGRCFIEVDGMSSDVTIRRSDSLPVTEALPTESSETKSLLPSAAEVPTAPDVPTVSSQNHHEEEPHEAEHHP